MERWRNEAKWEEREWRYEGRGKVDTDERKGSDRFRREGDEGGVERWKQGEKQRQGTQQVFPARLPPRLQVLSQGKDDTAAAMQAG